MAAELHVFLETERIPKHDQWQEMINSSGFPAAIQEPFNPKLDRGFCPVTYDGQSTGFEFYLEPSTETVDSYPHIAEKIAKRDVCATFRWSGDLMEMSAALSAAAALAKLADGIYYYPDDDLLYDGNEAIQATKRDLNLG